jgi:hypothetical protein
MSNAKKSLAQWVKNNDPFLFEVAKARYALEQGGLSGFSDFFTSLTDTIKDVAPSLINLQSQKKILDIQLKRANQGLPPLETAQYSPVIRVAPEITPATEQAAKNIAVESLKGGFKSMAPLLAVGGLLAFLLLRRR